MKNVNYGIRGSGGGGEEEQPSQHTPVESPDSLHSKQYARIIDLVSEGEIYGLVDQSNPLKSIYLDGTPIVSASGTVNFTGASVTTRNGTQSQSYIPGFSSVESEVAMSAPILYANPLTERIYHNEGTDAVRITISIPTLTLSNVDNGDLSGTSVYIYIQYNTNESGWVTAVNDTITGKTTSRYQRSYVIQLPAITSGHWDIRVGRYTADSTTQYLQNKTYWDSYTKIINAKLSYPNSALVALNIDSSYFRSIPSRGYDIKGLKVKLPDNYNPTTRVYTGVWSGNMTGYGWTDNPAWCFYDMITNDRYGLGEFISESQIDKWSLYTIAQYCDELVDNGSGGLEPRFTCNLYLQTREEAYKVINAMASIFRAIVYWAGGAIVPVQDSPSTPVALFTPANVIDGQFNYEGSSARARHTVVLVSWNDPANFYKQKIEYVEDAESIARYGVIQSEIVAVGCTSRGQAHRIGKWLLTTEKYESEIITFSTGLDGVLVNPGEVIKTSDPTRAGDRMGGRVVSATTTSVEIDAPILIESGKTYTLWVTLPDGTVVYKPVITTVGTHTTLEVSEAFSAAPLTNSMWVIACQCLIPETWRVISISEVEGSKASITAVAYREDKYAAVENNLALEPLPTSSQTVLTPNPVSNLDIVESLYLVGLGVVGTKATVSWTPGEGASHFIIRYTKLNENTVEVSTRSTSIDIGPLADGQYTFSVTAVSVLGGLSDATSKAVELLGKSYPPNDVSNFNLAVVNGHAYISWDASTDLDVIVGGNLRLRFTPEIAAPNWNNSIDIGNLIPGSTTSVVLPLLTGSYLAKWVDSTGNHSINAVYTTTDAADMLALNVLETINKHPTFPGVYTKVEYDGGLNAIKLSGSIDSILPNIDTWGNIDSLINIANVGTYEFDNYFDLGSVYTSRITSVIKVESYATNDLIDNYTQDIDDWSTIDGTVIDNFNAVLMISTTNGDPAASPTWSAWQPFYVGDWTARAYKFRLDVIAYDSSGTSNIAIKELTVLVDMPDRTESGEDIQFNSTTIISPNTLRVTFGTPYKAVPNVSISPQSMLVGDFYTLTNKNVTGFDIIFRNSAGTYITRTFDWRAKGY